jgi:NAD(P)-dependent dehydrogenase (short-subunit alcohol dehydrogenase family)
VNTINPSLRTDAWESWEAANPEFVQGLKDKMPLGRLGNPIEDGGPLFVFLAGPGSDYITGMTIMLNGGRHMP